MAKPISWLVGKLEKMASGAVLDSIKATIARESLKLVESEFSLETDPYGKLWVPTEYRGRKTKNKTLVDTGRLKNSFEVEFFQNGVSIINRTPYAAFHQYGTVKLPIRRMLPIASQGLPPRWSAMINKAANDAFKAAMQ